MRTVQIPESVQRAESRNNIDYLDKIPEYQNQTFAKQIARTLLLCNNASLDRYPESQSSRLSILAFQSGENAIHASWRRSVAVVGQEREWGRLGWELEDLGKSTGNQGD
jgi:hypothetical protein